MADNQSPAYTDNPVTQAESSESNTTTSIDPIEAPEVTPEVAAGTEPPKVTKAEAKKIEKQLKKLKIKVDQREEEVEFDPNDDEFMKNELQKSRAFSKRAQDFSSLQKEVAAFINELKKNPRKVLADPNIGIDVKQLAAQVIEEEIANSQKSPHQLEKEKLENELRELKEKQQKDKDEASQREFELLQQREYERYDILMTQALEKTDLPKTPYVVKKMADYMLLGLQNKVELTPEDVIPLVREEMQNDLKAMFAVMPDEVIESIVGKDVIGRIRKRTVAKAKANPPQPLGSAVKDVGAQGQPEEKPKPRISMRKYFGV